MLATAYLCRLERQFQSELDDPGVPGAGDPAQARIAELLAGRIPVGVIDGVEKLRAELRLQLLAKEGEVLAGGQVDPDRSGAGDDGAARGAVAERGLLNKAGSVEEAVHSLLAARQVRIANQVRTQRLVGSHLSDITRELRSHRKPGLQLDDRVSRPSGKRLLCDAVQVLAERQFVHGGDCETVRVIQVSPALFSLQVQDVLRAGGREPLASAAPTRIVRHRFSIGVGGQKAQSPAETLFDAKST